MSTRSHIAFYDAPAPAEDAKLKKPDCLLYRHSDGYPTGVLPELVPVLVHLRGRWRDTEYLAARTLQWLCNLYDDCLQKFDASNHKHTSGVDKIQETGYGICYDKKPHGDHEYYYAVYNTGVVDVYACGYDAKLEAYKHLGRVTLPSDGSRMSDAIIEDLAKKMEGPEGEDAF